MSTLHHNRRTAVKDFFRAVRIIEPIEGRPPQVAMVSSGPPGIGKTYSALRAVLGNRWGRLLEPAHGQAAERKTEAAAVRRMERRRLADAPPPPGTEAEVDAIRALGQPPVDPVEPWRSYPRHVEGLGRKCFYLPGDDWSPHGWRFAEAACAGCPHSRSCPGQQQFYSRPPIMLGVHSMAGWRPNPADIPRGVQDPLVLDELPQPVSTTVVDIEELARLAMPVWPEEIERWRAPIEEPVRSLVNELRWRASETPGVKSWGTTVQVWGWFPPGEPTRVRSALDRILTYMDACPLPPPPAQKVRAGSITPERWPMGNLRVLLDTLASELDGVTMAAREESGVVRTLCLRAYADLQGEVVKVQVEMRERWTPPNESAILLASLPSGHARILRKLFPHHEPTLYIRDVPLPKEGVELYDYDTYAFSRTRTMTPGGALTPQGTRAWLRGLRKVVRRACGLADRAKGRRLRIGIISHRGALASMGFPLHRNADGIVESWTEDGGRTRRASSGELEALLRTMEQRFDLVVGYHGNVVGSNKFKDVDLLCVFGDPTGHVGALAEDARCLREDPKWYVDWTIRTAATQEVYRARLLEAGPGHERVVAYFGAHAPDLGVPWTRCIWEEGGRLHSEKAFRLECALFEHSGTKRQAFPGAYDPVVSRLHVTRIGGLLYELRVALGIKGESVVEVDASLAPTDVVSPAGREAYRRAAAEVAAELGLRRFERPHPARDRRPVVLWARNTQDADDLLDEIDMAYRLLPGGRRARIEAEATSRDVAAEQAEQLAVEVEDVRQEVTELLGGRRTAVLLAGSDPDGRYVARTGYASPLRAALARWRELRTRWRQRSEV